MEQQGYQQVRRCGFESLVENSLLHFWGVVVLCMRGRGGKHCQRRPELDERRWALYMPKAAVGRAARNSVMCWL